MGLAFTVCNAGPLWWNRSAAPMSSRVKQLLEKVAHTSTDAGSHGPNRRGGGGWQQMNCDRWRRSRRPNHNRRSGSNLQRDNLAPRGCCACCRYKPGVRGVELGKSDGEQAGHCGQGARPSRRAVFHSRNPRGDFPVPCFRSGQIGRFQSKSRCKVRFS